MAKTKITMFLDPDLIEWLDLNRDEETSRSAYLRILIRKDMKSKARRKTNKPTSTASDPFTYSVITADMIPNDLKEYADLIVEWWAIRHKNKATCSTSVSERIFKKLRSFTPEAKKLALEKAITGGWKDIYEIKESFKQEQVTSHPPVAQFDDDGMIQ